MLPLQIALCVIIRIRCRSLENSQASRDLNVKVALQFDQRLSQFGFCALALRLGNLIDPVVLPDRQTTEYEKQASEKPQSACKVDSGSLYVIEE